MNWHNELKPGSGLTHITVSLAFVGPVTHSYDIFGPVKCVRLSLCHFESTDHDKITLGRPSRLVNMNFGSQSWLGLLQILVLGLSPCMLVESS